MRRDLGDDYESLFDDGDDTMDKGLLRLFSDTLSLKDGSLDNDDHGVEELMDDIYDISNKESQFKDSSYDCLVKRLQPSAALKLLNFIRPGGREYTILRPLRPILLMGSNPFVTELTY